MCNHQLVRRSIEPCQTVKGQRSKDLHPIKTRSRVVGFPARQSQVLNVQTRTTPLRSSSAIQSTGVQAKDMHVSDHVCAYLQPPDQMRCPSTFTTHLQYSSIQNKITSTDGKLLKSRKRTILLIIIIDHASDIKAPIPGQPIEGAFLLL